MKASPVPVFPLLIVSICLMGVFFYAPEAPGHAGKDKKPRIYRVATRFVVSSPAAEAVQQEEEWRRRQVAILSSRELLRSVVYRLSLDQYWRMSADAAVDRLKRHLTLQRDGGSGEVTLSGWGDKLDVWLEITDAVRDTYEEYRNNEAVEAAVRTHRRPPVESEIRVLEMAKETKAGKD